MRIWPRIVIAALATAAAAPLAQEARKRDARLAGPTAEQLQAREHHKQGLAFLRSERFAEAVEELGAAVRLDPELTMAHYDLGRAQMALKDFDAAVRAYGACRDSWQRFADSLQQGSLEADATREDRIRELRDRIRELQRIPVTQGSAQAAQLQIEMTRTENLITSLERGRGVKTRLGVPAELSLALGSAYFRGSKLEDAEREYQAAIAVQPKLGEAHNNLAVVYLLQGRAAEAKEAVKRAEKAGFRVNSGLKKDIEAALAR